METVTYTDLQEMVEYLPPDKLIAAYHLLRDLAEDNVDTASPQRDCLRLTPYERKKILAEQALLMVDHYKQAAAERQMFQAGDFLEYSTQ